MILSTIENITTDDIHTNVGDGLSILSSDDDDDGDDGDDGDDDDDDDDDDDYTYNVNLISSHNVNDNNHGNVFY